MAVNFDATLIPDKAEAWVAHKADVTDITTMFPASPTDDLAALGWEEVGMLDAEEGIPLNPESEVKDYHGFGYPFFRRKIVKGKLDTGFTMMEDNSVTRRIAMPGTAPNEIGIPKDVQIYVLYRVVDEDRAMVWVSHRPGAAQVTGATGFKEGELWTRTVSMLHSGNSDGNAFRVIIEPIVKVFTIAGGVTAYTSTVDGKVTTSITALTGAGLQTALRALPNVGPTGVTVVGASSPLTATFVVPVTTVSATGTGGTVTVA